MTVAQYVAELRTLAARCGLATASFDERARDQFSAWLYDNDMRESLLHEDDKSMLQHMVQLATKLERSALEEPALGERQLISRINKRGVRKSERVAALTVAVKITY